MNPSRRLLAGEFAGVTPPPSEMVTTGKRSATIMKCFTAIQVEWMMNRNASIISFVVVLAVSMVAARGVPAQDLMIQLVEPHERMPRYILSNLRIERDRNGRRVIKCEFRRTNEHKHPAEVLLRLNSAGELERPTVPFNFNAESGTIQVRPGQTISAEINRSGLEMLLAMDLLSSRRGPNGTEHQRVLFKVSNSVIIGRATESVTTRPPNEFETQRIDA